MARHNGAVPSLWPSWRIRRRERCRSLGRDPAMRWVVGGKAISRPLPPARWDASRRLATAENVEALRRLNGVWIDKVHDRHPPKMIILEWTAASARPMANKREQRNGHFGWLIRYSCSTSSATWRAVPCAPVMFTMPTDGGMFCEPVVMRYKERKVRRIFVAMPPCLTGDIRISRSRGITLRHPPQSERDSPAEHCPSAYATCRSPARPCSPFPRASAIRPDRGTRSAVTRGQSGVAPRRAGSSRRFHRLICRALPSGWWRSIITVARRSSTSRKARTPSTGPVCHVASSATMPIRLQLHALAYNLGNFMRITGFAEGGGALVDDDVARQVEDRGQGCPTWPLRYVPIG